MDNPIVFVHGAGDSARAWRAQTAFFGKRAYALDLPGHGERPDSLPEQASVSDYARTVETIVREELKLEKPIIAGHSLGGLIALQMGLMYRSNLGGLILIGSGARMRVLPALLEAARTEPAKATATLQQLATTQTDTQPSSTGQPGTPITQGANILYRDLQACNSFDVMTQLHELDALPTLIICGAEERNAPVKFSTYLHTHISGSTLTIIPEAGHYVQREKPTQVNQTIQEWLAAN